MLIGVGVSSRISYSVDSYLYVKYLYGRPKGGHNNITQTRYAKHYEEEEIPLNRNHIITSIPD